VLLPQAQTMPSSSQARESGNTTVVSASGAVRLQTNNVNVLNVVSTFNVGIGTTSPLAELTVATQNGRDGCNAQSLPYCIINCRQRNLDSLLGFKHRLDNSLPDSVFNPQDRLERYYHRGDRRHRLRAPVASRRRLSLPNQRVPHPANRNRHLIGFNAGFLLARVINNRRTARKPADSQ